LNARDSLAWDLGMGRRRRKLFDEKLGKLLIIRRVRENARGKFSLVRVTCGKFLSFF
jgi:hypothetical protein